MKHKLFFLIIILVCLLTACSYSSIDTKSEKAEKTVYAMDTVMNISAYGTHSNNVLNKAEAEIIRLDNLWRRKSESSEIFKLNEHKSAKVSLDTKAIVEKALEISESTNGTFDITIAPVMDLWGFYTKDFKVPGEEELQAALAEVNYKNVSVNGSKIAVDGNSQIDLGGIAKGYLSDRIIEIYRENGIKSGIVSLGGNVQTLGRKPDGSLWRVAIQNPESENEYIGILSVENKAVITSGGYQRYFEQNGITYHHIIDPKDGFPANSGLKSVTVISENGILADGLSTAFFVMGLEKSIDHWKSYADFDIIMFTEDDEIYITEDLKDVFESDYEYHIITR